MSSARVRIFTLGCKVNQCDSDEIARALAARGYEIGGRGDPAEIYIVNTCTVTAVADAKARKLIRRIARGHREATLIVTGCTARPILAARPAGGHRGRAQHPQGPARRLPPRSGRSPLPHGIRPVSHSLVPEDSGRV
jgi:hypothetical protein